MNRRSRTSPPRDEPSWGPAFREFCGEDQFQRFALALLSSQERGRLFYWQESLVTRFAEEYGLEVPGIEELLQVCWPGADPEDPDYVAPL